MKYCDYCKASIEVAKRCPTCGNYIYTFAPTFIFGKTKKDAYSCEIGLTDKFLIVKKRSKSSFIGQTVATAAGGIIGGMIAASAEKAKSIDFGYYPISNIKCAIYPYRNNKIKNNLAIKIINQDNTDFVLLFDLNGVFCESMAKRFVKDISNLGVKVESGLNQNYGDSFCNNPFVDVNTFGIYRYVNTIATNENSNNSTLKSINVSNISNQCDNNNFFAKFCCNCGNSITENDKFCSKCGQRIIR